MAKEQIRDFLSAPPEAQYFTEKLASGWRLVSVNWEREVPGTARTRTEEPPFGLEVSEDCRLLQDNALERLALIKMMELIVKEEPLDVVAAELNGHGYRTRQGTPWTPASIFDMLPRLIEAGPKILVDDEYVARKRAS